jgi:hypothetical protein
MKTQRFYVEMDGSQLEELDKVGRIGGLRNRKDLLNNAIAVLQWMVKRVLDGDTILAVNDRTDAERELVMPFLENVKSYRLRHQGSAEVTRPRENTVAAGG